MKENIAKDVWRQIKMNKEQIWGVLECCVLISDGVNLDQLVKDYGFDPLIAGAGIKLFAYLNSIQLKGGLQ